MRKLAILASVLLVAALALTACGGDDDDDSAAETSAPASLSTSAIHVSAARPA